jgi:hypothetical protein
MPRLKLRSLAVLSLTMVFGFTPSLALEFPISDTAVREAYFLGQRHDATLSSFYDKYAKYPAVPQTGPHIAAIRFLTPFAQLVEYSAQYHGNFSAQQALHDQRGKPELVKVIVQISLTTSYSAMVSTNSDSNSRAPSELSPRRSDFWKNFQVVVYNANQPLAPFQSSGKSNSLCGRSGPCRLTGASLELLFPADSFTSDTAVVRVIPPEGDAVSVDFSLPSLR